MKANDIYLASFPFGDTATMKLRPVLLLTGRIGTGTETVVAYVSAVIPSPLLDSDVLIDPAQPEHQATHLKSVSVVRLHKIATIHRTSLHRRLGRISGATRKVVVEKLRRVLDL